MKRFYRTAAAVVVGDHSFAIELDGRPVKTPGKRPLHLPAKPLAEAIAGEWAAQTEEIRPTTMALMRLACTVVDRVAQHRQEALDQIVQYAATELLCYWASKPEDLRQRQRGVWQPLLDWAARELGAPLRVTDGVIPIEQPASSIAAICGAVAAVDDWRLVALHTAAAVTGSVVLALALLRGRVDAATAWQVGQIDVDFQAERWGLDEQAEQAALRARADLFAAARFLSLLS